MDESPPGASFCNESARIDGDGVRAAKAGAGTLELAIHLPSDLLRAHRIYETGASGQRVRSGDVLRASTQLRSGL